MTASHARLAPSSAYQWLNCPGSLQLQELFPEDGDSEASREGTAAHEVAVSLAMGQPVPTVASNGVPVTQEMIDCGQVFADAVPDGASFEQRVHMPMAHPTDCWGTYDSGAVIPAHKKAVVADYKFGHGYVDAFKNPQLHLYAMGLLHSIGLTDPQQWHGWEIDIVIVQPRYYGSEGRVRRDWIDGTCLAQLADIYARSAALALSPDAPCKTGPWCKNCTALAHCDTARKMAGSALEWAGARTHASPTPESVGAELTYIDRALAILQSRRDTLHEIGASMPRVVGWSKQPKFGRLAWKVPDAEVIAVMDALGVDVRAPVKPQTPTQSKKLIDGAVIDIYAERPCTGVEFKPEARAEQILGAI